MTARTRSIIANGLLLLTGAGVGVGIDHIVLLHRHAAAGANISAAHAATLLTELDQELHLTPAQHDTIGAILVRHQQAIDSVWRIIHQRVDVGMDSVHRELFSVLQPEQVTLLHAWLRRQGVHVP